MKKPDCEHPRAFKTQLLVEEVPDGLLVYDLTRNRAHSLNRTATFVWRHCDGQTSIASIARQLKDELEIPLDENLVLLALKRLEAAHLVQLPATPQVSMSRRDLLRRVTRAGLASVLLPAVISIVAATPAYAGSAQWLTVIISYTAAGAGEKATVTGVGQFEFITPAKVKDTAAVASSFSIAAGTDVVLTFTHGGATDVTLTGTDACNEVDVAQPGTCTFTVRVGENVETAVF